MPDRKKNAPGPAPRNWGALPYGGLGGCGRGAPSSECSGLELMSSIADQAGALGQGAGDALTGGLYSKALGLVPGRVGEMYERQTRLRGYDAGLIAAAGLGLGRVLYASGARGASRLPGPQAVRVRNFLKGATSGFGPLHPRMYTYEEMLRRYGSDAGVRRAAGRTNKPYNRAGAAAVVSGSAHAPDRHRRREGDDGPD